MLGHQADQTWQEALIARHPALFRTDVDGRARTQGFPETDDGWRDLIERACAKIQAAIDVAPTGSIQIVQIKEKFATLRLYWHGSDLPEATVAAVKEAVALGEARSACTCERCGAAGRLFNNRGWYLTACDEHAKGNPVPEKPGRANVHIVRALKDGRIRVISCRRYMRETDTFVDVDPGSIGIEE